MDRTVEFSNWRAHSAYEQTRRFEKRLFIFVCVVLVAFVWRFI